MTFTSAVIDGMLDDLDIATTHASLHTADPGSTGAHEVVGGSYTRKAIAWSAASGGTKTIIGTLSFQIPAGTTITHLGTWSAGSGGTFAGGGVLAEPQTFAVAGVYVLVLSAVTQAPTAQANLGVISATTFGAVGDGVTDDTVAIQAALDSCLYGGAVALSGSHATSAPLLIPPQVGLRGLHGENLDQQQKPTLIPLAGFSGSAVVKMVDQTTGSYAVTSNDQRLDQLTIDGRNISSGTVHGIETIGYVHGIRITDVTARNLPGQGFKVTTSGGSWAYTVHALRFNVNNVTGTGIDGWISDCTWVDCEVIGVQGHGWNLNGPANSTFTNCRAEWNGLNGFEVTGSWSGTGSGGPQLIGCSTDRNTHHGVHISATSNAPVSIVGGMFRRDGRASTSAGYAGIFVDTAGSPVIITGVTVYPGTDDNGSGNATPQYGISVTGSTAVSYNNCSLHAISAAVHDGGGNTQVVRGDNIIERTGGTGSPVRTAPPGIPHIDVRWYGAVGDGVTDDTTAIQNALNAAPYDSVVLLSHHATSAPLTIPPRITLRGLHGGHIDAIARPTIKPLASFSGSSVLLMVDQSTGSYAIASTEQRIENLSIDADDATGSTIRGIRAEGFVHGVYITDVAIQNTPGNGVSLASNGSGTPYSWHVLRLHVNAAGGFGINGTMTDTTWIDCEVLGCTLDGWSITGSTANSTFIGCRAEWSTQNGFALSGSIGTGQGSGGFSFIGCSTDRNGQNGFSIASTGNATILISGCMLRRDGRSSTSSGYAAIKVASATVPVQISDCTVYPGVNDDGTGNATPQYGFSISGSASVVYDGCSIHAISAAVLDGGTNTRLLRGPNILERTGTTASPTTTDRGLLMSETALDYTGHALGAVTPREHNLISWTQDPATISSGSAGTAGTVYLATMYVNRSATATKLLWGINTAGSGATASQNYVGIYDSTGTRVAVVGVDARVTTTGLFTETISLAVTPGLYYAAFLFNASGMPQIYRGSFLTATLSNAGITTAASYRFSTNGTAQTTLPTPITLSSNTAAQNSYFAALG